MMSTSRPQGITNRIIDQGVVAVVRLDDAEKVTRVVHALNTGGITAIEVTVTTPGALEAIEDVARMEEGVLLGVGSVLDAETVRSAVNAGARYVVSPVFKKDVVEAAHQQGVPVFPGCFTPTEVQRAHEAGADIVKLFPASAVGADYCRALRAPLPHLEIMPTGGVTPETVGDWFRAGASVVAVGSALVDQAAVDAGNFEQLTENARAVRQSVDEARAAV